MTRRSPKQALLSVWLRTSLRHWWRHKLQSVTLIAILALGVASFLSIRMANRAAIQGFSGFTESVTGQIDFTLETPGDRFSVHWLSEIRRVLGQEPVELVPVLEVAAVVISPTQNRTEPGDKIGAPGENIRILAMDLIGIKNINNKDFNNDLLVSEETGKEPDIFATLGKAGAIFISPRLAGKLGLKSGSDIEVLIDDQKLGMVIEGILPTSRSGVDVPENLAIMDIAALMVLTEKTDSVSRVEVIVEADNKSEFMMSSIKQRLVEASGDRWKVLQPEQQEATGAAMTSAFRLNLTILSLISLLVGLYLITQSIDAAVIQRRKEIGILRALGLLPVEIKRLWLMDLTVFGFLGSVGGIMLGWATSQIVVIAIARTVNALYTETTANSAQLNGTDCLIGLALGIGGSLIAGAFPLSIATKTDPSKILASGRHEISGTRYRFQWTGWLFILCGYLFSFAKPLTIASGQTFPVLGYITALFWLLGGALVVAGLIAPLGRFLHGLAAGHLTTGLGFGKLRIPGNRHRLAVSGLFIAIGMAASMSILIGSFETTITHWLKTRFQADIYIASRAFSGSSSQHFMRASTIERLSRQPGIEAIATQRYLPIEFQDKPVYLVGINTALVEKQEKFLWISPLLDMQKMPEDASTWAIINETFQYRFGYKTGDVITLTSPGSTHNIWIRGMKADYGNDRGAILIDHEYLGSWYGVSDYSSVMLYLEFPSDSLAFAERLKKQFPELAIREQEALLKNALQVFKETFAVTYALKILGLFVAVMGLALALLNILREDVSSLHTLHALGVTRIERACITASEGFGMTLVATLGGILLSFALGWLLIFVINRQSFGWTLQYALPWGDILSMAAILLLLGGMVSGLVGWFSGNQKPLQEE